jgi:DAACS family dicarboxylate/amino acid:cation (Na+ or H+) symporter
MSSGVKSYSVLLGLLVGGVAGLLANYFLGGDHSGLQWVIRNIAEPLGQTFLRLLLLIVIPLVFPALVLGVVEMGDVRKLGRVAGKSLALCCIISAIAVVLGVVLTQAIKPGKKISPATAQQLQERFQNEATRRVGESQKAGASSNSSESGVLKAVKTIIPTNPVASLASDPPQMLHLMFFAVVLGVGVLLSPADLMSPLLGALRALSQASMKIMELVMRFAAVPVGCLVFVNTANFGVELLAALGWFVLVVLFGLLLHGFGTYSLALIALGRTNPLWFFKAVRGVMLTAFSTSSSNATLPTTLVAAEEKLKLPRRISSFVLTVGATANQNGTALYEGVTVLFLAQLAGMELTFAQQLLVCYLAVLGSIGTAGIPSASIPFIILVLGMIGVNPALIALILGVDRILDMCRTVVNVVGDLVVTVCVARSEKEAPALEQ